MKKVKLKANAKINLTLDVFKSNGVYHPINSLVASIGVYDKIRLVKRNDYKVTLTERGLSSACPFEKNNAVKAAKAFMEKFNTTGVDIILDKNIAIGGGLGGSSADIAGVLNGMKRLYGVSGVEEISSALASDATYMLKGGYAVISDRGNTVRYISHRKSLPLIIITNPKSISAGDSYRAFDALESPLSPTTERAERALVEGDNEFYSLLKNDLYLPSLNFIPQMEKDIETVKNSGAMAALMTGSGSAIYGVFDSVKARNAAFKALKALYKDRVIKTKTLPSEK